MEKETLQKFILDPEFDEFFNWMLSFLETDTDIESINPALDSSVVHAEVIARQSIKYSISNLKHAIEVSKSDNEEKRTTFK